MIRAYSQRLMPPYSGQMQVVESERARALTLDGDTWEIQFQHGVKDPTDSSSLSRNAKPSYMRVATIKYSDIRQKILGDHDGQEVDDRIIELIDYLAEATLPFPAADAFEFWLLDSKDESPLALIYSCTQEEQKKTFPERAEWTALPAAVMPIERSEEEIEREYAPINYRFERLVAERAGFNAKARWFSRADATDESFPPLLVKEDWEDPENTDLCQRYLHRQAPRLLMLHGLQTELRKRLEINARAQALEVARFYQLYPEVVDQSLIDVMLVEARLRSVTEGQPSLHKRRDGILYI